MKPCFIVVLSGCLLLYANSNKAQVTMTTATSTSTVNGKKTSYSKSISTSGNATGITISGAPNDTTGWKTREISTDFSIRPDAPIFIESAYRNIEIKTWNQPNVRFVANTKYKDDKDANLSFDEILEKNGVKIKSSDGAFEILGAANERNASYTVNYSYDNTPTAVAFSTSPNMPAISFSDRGRDSSTMSASSIAIAGDYDSTVFPKNTNQQAVRWIIIKKKKDKQIKILADDGRAMQAKAIAEGNSAIKKQDEAQKARLTSLSKQMESLSKKLALLTLEDADKNNKEITKLNQEIGKLSNQIAFQSLGNYKFFFAIDSTKKKWNTSEEIINWGGTPATELTSVGTVPVFWEVGSSPKTSLKWTIYIPENHKVSIESKYGNIVLDNDVDNAKIISKYGNVETKNVDNLIVRNEYGNVNTNNVNNGDIEVRNGKLKMQNVDNLIIDSKNTSVDLNEVGNIKVESSNDNYDVSSVQALDANKNYGSFRLTTLNGKMKFNGVNADIKIRNISPQATDIAITDKFAKIALPFSDIKNYHIAVNGNFNSSFDDFNKTYVQPANNTNSDKRFTATGGNGKDLKTLIDCHNCQLDFK